MIQTKIYDLNKNPGDFPAAMERATRIGRLHALEMRQKIRNTRELSDLIAPGCANGFATPLKQAYNAGYWSATI